MTALMWLMAWSGQGLVDTAMNAQNIFRLDERLLTYRKFDELLKGKTPALYPVQFQMSLSCIMHS
jgi:hypothetical protein